MKVLKDRKHAKKKSDSQRLGYKNTTVSILHKEHLKKLKDAYTRIPQIYKILEVINKRIQDLKNESQCMGNSNSTNPVFLTTDHITLAQRELMDLEKKRDLLQSELAELDNKKHLEEYYVKTGHLLVEYLADDYYDPAAAANTIQKTGASNLAQFFTFTRAPPKINSPPVATGDNSSTKRTMVSKQEVMSTFYRTIDNQFMGTTPEVFLVNNDICSDCGHNRVYNPVNSYMLCEECGLEEKILIDNETRSFKEPPREITFFAYKRINHFNEWLAEFQGRASTCVTDDLIRQIQSELRKESYIQEEDITLAKVKEILKKLDLTNKYNEHCFYILFRLTGKPPPTLDDELIEKLRNMFRQIQGPWQRHCPPDRNNFFSYPYIFYKFCELLERDEYLPICRDLLLKGEDKLMEHDEVWKKICNDLEWDAIRTI
jgi:hypothetical protein